MIPSITRTTTKSFHRTVWNRTRALGNSGRHQRQFTSWNDYTTALSSSSSSVHVSDYDQQKGLPIQNPVVNIQNHNQRLVNVSVLYRNFFSTAVANDRWSQQSPQSQSNISSAVTTEEKNSVELGSEEKLAADPASEDPTRNLAGDPTIREKLRAKYDEKKQAYRENLVELRESAKDHYREYREHPTQTAKKDVKSISSMIREYGPVFIGTYIACYFSTLGLLFAGVQSGVLDPVVLFHWLGQTAADTATSASGATGSITEAEATAAAATSTVQLVVDFLESHDFTKPYAPYIEKNPAVANLAVAWIAVKFTEPVRLAASVTLTPRVARYLGHKPSFKDGGKAE